VYDSVGKDTCGAPEMPAAASMLVISASRRMIADFKFRISHRRLLVRDAPDAVRLHQEPRGSLIPRRGSVRSARVGKSKPRSQRAALREAAEAHRDLESRRTIGATVLLP